MAERYLHFSTFGLSTDLAISVVIGILVSVPLALFHLMFAVLNSVPIGPDHIVTERKPPSPRMQWAHTALEIGLWFMLASSLAVILIVGEALGGGGELKCLVSFGVAVACDLFVLQWILYFSLYVITRGIGAEPTKESIKMRDSALNVFGGEAMVANTAFSREADADTLHVSALNAPAMMPTWWIEASMQQPHESQNQTQPTFRPQRQLSDFH